MFRIRAVVLFLSTIFILPSAFAVEHFDPKGKPPSKHTIAIVEELRKTLNFADDRDFKESERGFIASPDFRKIKADAGHVAWDIESYDFLLTGEPFDMIHPSLQRQATLNMNYGLYEVIPGRVYQVRGFDLANITFVASDSGWVVFDPLTASETARAALELLHQHVEPRPVKGVVYSHSHGDHFGGVLGVTSREAVANGEVEIIVPRDFMAFAVSENVFAGTAMNRRLFYQYGVALPRHPYAHVDQSIGKNVAAGNLGLIPPTLEIREDLETHEIDGLTMVFQNTPNTEAPAEMNTFFPQLNAIWVAENITHTMHNIYTLRGALVRDALEWSKQISKAIYLFGADSEVLFSSHGPPRWGKERVFEIMRAQRDIYAHMNNYALHLANQGVTINTVHNEFYVPQSLQDQWHTRGYHGSVEHNSRAVINRYLGYWDGNPTTLIPLNPEDSAPLYVEMMGGAEAILAKGAELYESGDYKLGMEILNKLVYAEPDNQTAKDALADHFEQIGYQQESPSVRNSFLAAAYELRNGIPTEAQTAKTTGADMMAAMTTELFLDFLGVRMDPKKAKGMAFVINIVHPDTDERFVLEMSNSVLSATAGFLHNAPDLTFTINRSDMVRIMAGQATLESIVADRNAALQGDLTVMEQLASTMVEFDLFFEIMSGTGGSQTAKTGKEVFDDVPIKLSGE